MAHAADTAVRVRSAEMWRYYSPASLVDHLALLLLAQLDGSPSPCRDNDWRWQAGPFRWNQVRASLIKWQGMNGFGRHPDTDAWQKRYGIEIPGETSADQLAAVTGWVDAGEGQRPLLLFGADRPSPLEEAVGTHRTDAHWSATLTGQLESVLAGDESWPHAYLAQRSLKRNENR